jgi:uncharacterized protein
VSSELQPTSVASIATESSESRVAAVDLARGVALLGVALVNVHAFAATWASLYGLDLARGAADVMVEILTAMLFTHRSYPVLSFLFGVGLAWQWSRLSRTSDASPRPQQLRPRLWALLLIGLAHGLLLWPGDVLATYGLMGLLIVTLLRLSTRAILALTLTVYGVTFAFYLSIGWSMMTSSAPPYVPLETTSSFAARSVSTALSLHFGEYLERGLVQIIVSDFWAHALLGMWAARSGVLPRFLAAPLANRRLIVAGTFLFAVGSGLELFAARYGGWNALASSDYGYGLMTIALLPASLGGLWLWLTVAACWGQSRFADRPLASLVSAAGRAPLTQFIGQSVVFAVLFNKSLVGLHGEPGRAAYSLIALATWLLLCAFIRAWLASGHLHGPMEIVWRRLTRAFSPPPAT